MSYVLYKQQHVYHMYCIKSNKYMSYVLYKQQQVYVIQVLLSKTCMTYTIAVCTVLDS